MASADVNGQRINFEDTGGSGPAVIFSHGFLMDRTMFEPQVAALTPGFRCITWDERGFGGTAATGPFTYWDSANDALALLDHLSVDAAFFVGMSQGGFVSLRAALTAPDRVRGLGLIDTQSGVEAAETRPIYEAMVDDWTTNGPHDELAAAVASIIFGGGYDASAWIAKWQAGDKAAIREPFTTLMGRDDVTSRLGEITAPTIIFHGEEDAAIAMAHAELVRIPGAGHASNLSHPDAVNGPLIEFLRKNS